jgi:hypothetical protein
MGFGRDEPSTDKTLQAPPQQATPMPVARSHTTHTPHARPAQTSQPVRVARPAPHAKDDGNTEKTEAKRNAPAEKAEPAHRQTAEAEAPAQRPSSAAGLMKGAAPVVPTGSFESRWQTFR